MVYGCSLVVSGFSWLVIRNQGRQTMTDNRETRPSTNNLESLYVSLFGRWALIVRLQILRTSALLLKKGAEVDLSVRPEFVFQPIKCHQGRHFQSFQKSNCQISKFLCVESTWIGSRPSYRRCRFLGKSVKSEEYTERHRKSQLVKFSPFSQWHGDCRIESVSYFYL